jgi:outer membrane lipoprotein-sorting protein
MVTFKILIAMLSVCATLFLAAIVHSQAPDVEATPTTMPASKLAVRNAPRLQADPFRSVTATPNARQSDPVAKLIKLDLPKPVTVDVAPTATAAPTVMPSPTPRPTASFSFDLNLNQVAAMKPVDALKAMTGRQFSQFPMRVTTRTRTQQGETHEHTLTIVSADRWSEVNRTDVGAVEIVQVGPIRYRREGGEWQVFKATRDVLPSADKMARDASDGIDLLAANVEVEGDYALDGRATLLYYFAYHQQADSGSRVWFDKQTLRPLLNETTLADGSMITIKYEYGDGIAVEPPVSGGW